MQNGFSYSDLFGKFGGAGGRIIAAVRNKVSNLIHWKIIEGSDQMSDDQQPSTSNYNHGIVFEPLVTIHSILPTVDVLNHFGTDVCRIQDAVAMVAECRTKYETTSFKKDWRVWLHKNSSTSLLFIHLFNTIYSFRQHAIQHRMNQFK